MWLYGLYPGGSQVFKHLPMLWDWLRFREECVRVDAAPCSGSGSSGSGGIDAVCWIRRASNSGLYCQRCVSSASCRPGWLEAVRSARGDRGGYFGALMRQTRFGA